MLAEGISGFLFLGVAEANFVEFGDFLGEAVAFGFEVGSVATDDGDAIFDGGANAADFFVDAFLNDAELLVDFAHAGVIVEVSGGEAGAEDFKVSFAVEGLFEERVFDEVAEGAKVIAALFHFGDLGKEGVFAKEFGLDIAEAAADIVEGLGAHGAAIVKGEGEDVIVALEFLEVGLGLVEFLALGRDVVVEPVGELFDAAGLKVTDVVDVGLGDAVGDASGEFGIAKADLDEGDATIALEGVRGDGEEGVDPGAAPFVVGAGEIGVLGEKVRVIEEAFAFEDLFGEPFGVEDFLLGIPELFELPAAAGIDEFDPFELITEHIGLRFMKDEFAGGLIDAGLLVGPDVGDGDGDDRREDEDPVKALEEDPVAREKVAKGLARVIDVARATLFWKTKVVGHKFHSIQERVVHANLGLRAGRRS